MSKIRVDEIVDIVDEGSPDLPYGATCIEPTADNQVATKSYVDSSLSGTFTNSVSSTPPADPAIGAFWVDTLTDLSILKCWNGSAWEEFSGMVGGVVYLMGIADPTVVSPNNNAGYPDTQYSASSSAITSVASVGGGLASSPINLAASWQDITYGGGKFVAIGRSAPLMQTDQRVMWSTNGISWTAADHAEANQWKGIAYGDGKYVAVSSDGSNRVMWSTDAITWNSASPPSANSWSRIAYGEPNGQPTFVVVAASNSGNRFMYSHDAINWSGANPVVGENYWYDVAYGDGKFVAVAATTDADRVKYSTDGISWTTGAVGLPTISFKGVTYGEPNGQPTWVIISPNNAPYYSYDGINWSAGSGADDNHWVGITYGEPNGQPMFVAVSSHTSNETNKHAMYSSDGINWTGVNGAVNPNMATTTYSWGPVQYGDGVFVTLATWAMSSGNSDIVGYSYDGVSWANSGTTLTFENDNIFMGDSGQLIPGKTLENTLQSTETLQDLDSLTTGTVTASGTLSAGFSGTSIDLTSVSGSWSVGMKIRSLRNFSLTNDEAVKSYQPGFIGSIPAVSQGAVSTWGNAEWNVAEDSAFTINSQTSLVTIVNKDQTQIGPSDIILEANKDYYVRVKYSSLEPAISLSGWSETSAFKTETVTFPDPSQSPFLTGSTYQMNISRVSSSAYGSINGVFDGTGQSTVVSDMYNVNDSNNAHYVAFSPIQVTNSLRLWVDTEGSGIDLNMDVGNVKSFTENNGTGAAAWVTIPVAEPFTLTSVGRASGNGYWFRIGGIEVDGEIILEGGIIPGTGATYTYSNGIWLAS